MKFNIFKNSSSKLEAFLNELEITKINLLALVVKRNTLSAQFEMNDDLKSSVEITDKSIKFTNQAKKTNKFNDHGGEHLPNLLAHIREALLFKIENAKEIIHRHPNIDSPSEGELKGEEWIRVTSHVLKESLKNAKSNENQIVEGSLFIGKMKEEELFTIRLQCYNLDYTYSFLTNGALNISVYDDKNFERGHSKKAAYMGEFYNNRPQLLDEIFKVIYEILNNSDLKIF